MQVLIEVLVVRFDDVGEAMKKVAHRDDDVVLDDGVDAAVVEQFDDVGELLFAEVRAEAHELAVGKDADDLQFAA